MSSRTAGCRAGQPLGSALGALPALSSVISASAPCGRPQAGPYDGAAWSTAQARACQDDATRHVIRVIIEPPELYDVMEREDKACF